jgi:hypothetical protein
MGLWANAGFAVTALYFAGNDTTVASKTEPRQTAAGSPPFGSRSHFAAGVGAVRVPRSFRGRAGGAHRGRFRGRRVVFIPGV